MKVLLQQKQGHQGHQALPIQLTNPPRHEPDLEVMRAGICCQKKAKQATQPSGTQPA